MKGEKGDRKALALLATTLGQIHTTARVLREVEEAIAREAGQSAARWQVLSIASSGEWTVPHIARRLGLARQSVQRVAHALVGDDLAQFVPNPDHQSSPYLQLTLQGSQTCATIARSVDALQLKLADLVERKRIKSMRRDLHALQEAVTEALIRPDVEPPHPVQ